MVRKSSMDETISGQVKSVVHNLVRAGSDHEKAQDSEEPASKVFSKHVVTRRIQDTLERLSQESMRYHTTEPWASQDADSWGRVRVTLAKVILTSRWETVVGGIAALNMLIIIWEADYSAQCYPAYRDNFEECPYDSSKVLWVVVVNWLLLLLYSFEVLARMFVHRRLFFFNRWNLLDLIIVVSGWAGTIIGGESVMSSGLLRMLRAVRLLRTLRIVLSIRELYLLLNGLISSMKSIVWGTVLLAIILALWGIVLVEFVHPTHSMISFDDCDDCAVAFQSVAGSMLMLFKQVITGDSWGQTNVPLIQHAPWLAPIPIGIVLTVSVGLMNLILAVIVESAGEARDRDTETKLRELETSQIAKKVELLRICETLDTDHSGTITLDEMHDAWHDHPVFRKVMCDLRITKNELDRLFEVVDEDLSGTVDYKEFIDQIYGLRMSDTRVMLAQQRNQMSAFKKDMVEMIQGLEAKHKESLCAINRHSQATDATLAKHSAVLDSLGCKLLGRMYDPGPFLQPFTVHSVPSSHDSQAGGCCDEGSRAVGEGLFNVAESQADIGLGQDPSDQTGLLLQRSLDRILKFEEAIADRTRAAAAALSSRFAAALEAERCPTRERVEWLEKHVRRRFATLVRDLESFSFDQAEAFDEASRWVEALSTGQVLQERTPSFLLSTPASESDSLKDNGSVKRFTSGQRSLYPSSTPAAPVAPREPSPPPHIPCRGELPADSSSCFGLSGADADRGRGPQQAAKFSRV